MPEMSVAIPGEAARHPYAEESDALAKWLLYSQIIGATFLQKIPVTAGKGSQLFLAMFVMLGATAWGLLARRLEFRRTPFALYLIMLAGMVSTQLISGHEYSGLSLALMLTIHLPYVFGLKSGLARPGVELIFFRKVMMTLAVLGILQFGLQFLIGWQYAFFLDYQLPHQWIMKGYNELNTIRLGSHQFKSNGVFMLEPAMFCQFLAISIIVEMVYFQRAKVILLYIAAILTTFSGTGLVILGLVVPFYLLKQRKFMTLVLLVLGVMLFIAIAPFIGMEGYVGRIHEFSRTTTSGYARFISIFPAIRDFILPHTDTMLFGMGAGAHKMVGAHMAFEVHPPSWGKILIEYGLIGLACYMPLMIKILFAPKRSAYLKAALFIQFFFDGYVLIPTVHGVIIALLAWPEPRPPERIAQPA